MMSETEEPGCQHLFLTFNLLRDDKKQRRCYMRSNQVWCDRVPIWGERFPMQQAYSVRRNRIGAFRINEVAGPEELCIGLVA
jgi:hypothetical protein